MHIWAFPSVGLYAHTAQALSTLPVSASIPNADCYFKLPLLLKKVRNRLSAKLTQIFLRMYITHGVGCCPIGTGAMQIAGVVLFAASLKISLCKFWIKVNSDVKIGQVAGMNIKVTFCYGPQVIS